jgi:hypothetical protein
VDSTIESQISLTGKPVPTPNDWQWSKTCVAFITGGNLKLNPDFKEFIAFLNESEVHYLVVGGYAVAVHGHPRYTKDLDVWVWIDRNNAERLLRALDAFGFGSLGITVDDLLTPDQVLQLGYPPNRIDILTNIDGVEFEECYRQKVDIPIDDIVVHFIDLENLRRNKKASGRLQDLADLENLE